MSGPQDLLRLRDHALPLVSQNGSQAPARTADPARLQEAAQQFEAILIGQILQSADSDGGWLGGADSSSSCATGFAEEQLAASIAQHGGLGLAKLITEGLQQQAKP